MRRWKRGLVAAAVAGALCVGAGAPAEAGPQPRPTGPAASVVAFDWVSAAIAVYGALRGGGDSGASIAQVLAAVEAAKTEIINHTDALASAEVQACARAATIEFQNIDLLPRSVLILWAQDATRCATLASAFARTVVSPAAADQIGFVVGPLFAIVFAARAKAGLTEGLDLILQDEITAYQYVAIRLGPGPGACVPKRIEGQIEYWTCTAYNGDSGRGYPASAAWAIAARNTSEPIAQAALPRLTAALNGG